MNTMDFYKKYKATSGNFQIAFIIKDTDNEAISENEHFMVDFIEWEDEDGIHYRHVLKPNLIVYNEDKNFADKLMIFAVKTLTELNLQKLLNEKKEMDLPPIKKEWLEYLKTNALDSRMNIEPFEKDKMIEISFDDYSIFEKKDEFYIYLQKHDNQVKDISVINLLEVLGVPDDKIEEYLKEGGLC